MADVDDADTARDLVRIGRELSDFAANLGQAVKVSGAHIIAEFLTPEHCEPLAERCEEAARQLRLYAVRRADPAPVVVDRVMAEAAQAVDQHHEHDHGFAVGAIVTGISNTAGRPCVGPIVEVGDLLTEIQSGSSRVFLYNDTVELHGSASAEACGCDGSGVLRWQQPGPDGRGGTMLRHLERLCVCGRAGSGS
jgi:hypothetical protein